MWKVAPADIARRSAGVEAVEFVVGFMMCNDGPGLIRNLYVTAKVIPPRGGTQAAFLTLDRTNWTGAFDVGVMISLVSNDSYKVAPKAWAIPLGLKLSFAPPFESALQYEITFGSQGTPTRAVQGAVDAEVIHRAYFSFLRTRGTEGSAHQFVSDVMAFTQSEIGDPDFYGDQERG
jgi:hypothetical protein